MKTSHALLAILGAAAAGVAVGILTAPRKGSETREQIKDFIKTRYPQLKEKSLDAIVKQIAGEIDE